jgi:hypothetical protein
MVAGVRRGRVAYLAVYGPHANPHARRPEGVSAPRQLSYGLEEHGALLRAECPAGPRDGRAQRARASAAQVREERRPTTSRQACVVLTTARPALTGASRGDALPRSIGLDPAPPAPAASAAHDDPPAQHAADSLHARERDTRRRTRGAGRPQPPAPPLPASTGARAREPRDQRRSRRRSPRRRRGRARHSHVGGRLEDALGRPPATRTTERHEERSHAGHVRGGLRRPREVLVGAEGGLITRRSWRRWRGCRPVMGPNAAPPGAEMPSPSPKLE